MNSELLEELKNIGNYAILDGYCKAVNVVNHAETILVSVSGGADSDVVLDIIHNVDNKGKAKYYWINTGLEYEATKEHIKYLEQKYGIEICIIKPKKSIPICVKEYGVPFLSKYTSEQMYRLQQHGFQWEDEPLDVLMEKYPKCKVALQWWTNSYYTAENGIQQMSRFSINRNKWLKEFIMQNPPDFPIANKCCEYAKKQPGKKFIKENDADLNITGIRKTEGGIRSVAYKSCFSEDKSRGCNSYRPIFWYKNEDKKAYEEHFGVAHSRCYTEYGMKRTGCVGCPYNRKINEELEIIQKYEPKLYKAAMSIFGKSYEYTKKYREFAKMMNEKEKEKK